MIGYAVAVLLGLVAAWLFDVPTQDVLLLLILAVVSSYGRNIEAELRKIRKALDRTDPDWHD